MKMKVVRTTTTKIARITKVKMKARTKASVKVVRTAKKMKIVRAAREREAFAAEFSHLFHPVLSKALATLSGCKGSVAESNSRN